MRTAIFTACILFSAPCLAQTAAVVDANGIILNVIVADPARHPGPVGAQLLAIPPGTSVDTKWKWSAARGFVPPRQFAIVDDQTRVVSEVREMRDGDAVPVPGGKTAIELKRGSADGAVRAGWKREDGAWVSDRPVVGR